MNNYIAVVRAVVYFGGSILLVFLVDVLSQNNLSQLFSKWLCPLFGPISLVGCILIAALTLFLLMMIYESLRKIKSTHLISRNDENPIEYFILGFFISFLFVTFFNFMFHRGIYAQPGPDFPKSDDIKNLFFIDISISLFLTALGKLGLYVTKLNKTISKILPTVATTLAEQLHDAVKLSNFYIVGSSSTYHKNALLLRAKLDIPNEQNTKRPNHEIGHLFESMLGFYQYNTAHGVLIVRPNTDIREYADICRRFLDSTTETIWSMNDIGLDLTFDLFSSDNNDGNKESVMKWIKEVNNRASNEWCKIYNDTYSTKVSPIKVKRIQTVTEGRYEFFTVLKKCLKQENEIQENDNDLIDLWRWTRGKAKHGLPNDNKIKLLKWLKNGLDRYRKHYVRGWVEDIKKEGNKENFEWYVYDACNNLRDQVIRGEYIIFDGKYLVRYNEEARILEIILGEIVERFARPFRDPDVLDAIKNDSIHWVREIEIEI